MRATVQHCRLGRPLGAGQFEWLSSSRQSSLIHVRALDMPGGHPSPACQWKQRRESREFKDFMHTKDTVEMVAWATKERPRAVCRECVVLLPGSVRASLNKCALRQS